MRLIPWRADETAAAAWPFASMDRLFDGFLTESARAWTPALDVREDEAAFQVDLEIPGVDPKDVEITVLGNELTISGEKKDGRTEKAQGWSRSERTYGAFRRTLALPEGVDAASVTADGAHGVLSIRIPKPAAAQPRKIQVKAK